MLDILKIAGFALIIVFSIDIIAAVVSLIDDIRTYKKAEEDKKEDK